jgi:hypothetical protein
MPVGNDGDVSYGGDGVVNVSDTLDIKISGSGSLTYTGDPSVAKDISGSGKVVEK